MRTPEAQQVMASVRSISKATGGGPTNTAVVMQQMFTVSHSGKLSGEMLQRCRSFLVDAEEHSIPSDELIAVVVPVIKRVHYMEVVKKATDGFAKNIPPEIAAADFDVVARLGNAMLADTGLLDLMVADDAFLIKKDDEVTCKLGIDELDNNIGGLEKQALGLLVGGSGAGKSMALAHIAVESLYAGHDVAFITLELGRTQTGRRIFRNIVDMTQREINVAPVEARSRYAAAKAAGLGQLQVAYMEPIETNPRMIRQQLIELVRDNPTFNPKVICVDFVDKVRVNKSAKAYDDMLQVTDALRSIAVNLDGWMWTASQSTRQATGKAWLDLEAVADSMNKVRSADLVIGIGRTEEDEANGMVRFTVPKRREGEGAHQRVGPLPWDPAKGRICTISRVNPWP
jgi:KaiC/GvpD/RAD55 family RecA-like ATPase